MKRSALRRGLAAMLALTLFWAVTARTEAAPRPTVCSWVKSGPDWWSWTYVCKPAPISDDATTPTTPEAPTTPENPAPPTTVSPDDPTTPTTVSPDPTSTTPTTTVPETPTGPPPMDGTNCANVPSACGYPDATNTGTADQTLTRIPEDVSSGPGWDTDAYGTIRITEPGTVLDGITTRGSVEIFADNVTVKNSRIQVGFDSWAVGIRHATGTVVANNDLLGASGSTGRGLVGVKTIYGDEQDTTVVGNDISWFATGVQIYSGLIGNNYIHDMGFVPGDHTNGTTSNGGTTSQLDIVHNTIFNQRDQTDAISLFEDFGVETNRLIDSNLVAGGGYCIYGGQNAGGQLSTNVKITNNRFSRKFFPDCGSYGPLAAFNSTAPGNAWSGNVWDETLAPVGS